MAIGNRRGTVRDIRALARRVFERFRAFPRQHGGQGVPINDTLSRILEHEPEHQPLRPRKEDKQRPPLKNPGIFTVQEDVADVLKTTVGDLLGEPAFIAARDFLSTTDRRKLRQAWLILHELFDLDDEALDADDESSGAHPDPYRFIVPPEEFITRDHDYPRTLHAWVVPDVPVAAGESGAEVEIELTTTRVLHSIREVWDARLQVLRVIGESMSPELQNGWKVLVDTQLTKPTEGALVAVYLKDEGGVLGRWRRDGSELLLEKSNPMFPAIHLGTPEEWTLWGTVTRIVEAPVAASRP
jgi:peptidase S24-like protein